MSVERKPISSLFDPTLNFKVGRLQEDHADLTTSWAACIGLYTPTGDLVAFVGEDDLFDADGNRFELDE